MTGVCVTKYFVGSSGTVWASEFMQLRNIIPHKFQVNEGDVSIPLWFTGAIFMLHDAFLFFVDFSEVNDFNRISNEEGCPHRRYHHARISTVLTVLWSAIDAMSLNGPDGDVENERLESVNARLREVHQ